MHVDRLHTFGGACAKFYFLSLVARAHTHIHTTLTSPNLMAASNFDLATFSELHFSTQRHLLSAPPPKPCPPTHLPTHPSTQTHPVCHPTPQLSIQTMPPSERRSKKKPKFAETTTSGRASHPPRSDHNSSREGGKSDTALNAS